MKTLSIADAQDIIDRYAPLLSDAKLFADMSKAVDQLNAAAASIAEAADLIAANAKTIQGSTDLSRMPSVIVSRADGCIEAVATKILEEAQHYKDLAWTISMTLDPKGKRKSKRIAPGRLYTDATDELIARYETLTGQKVPKPVEAEGGQATQYSTAFIADCLNQIDPLCDVAMAITCIRNARHERVAKNPEIKVGDNPLFDAAEAIRLHDEDPVRYSAEPRK